MCSYLVLCRDLECVDILPSREAPLVLGTHLHYPLISQEDVHSGPSSSTRRHLDPLLESWAETEKNLS